MALKSSLKNKEKILKPTKTIFSSGLFSSNVGPLLLMACLCYIPIILTKPGIVSVDDKQYLYIDPIRYFLSAASIWSSSIDLGTVTHQTIGFLFPMGEWYSFFHILGFPAWVAQRLWLSTIYFLSGSGIYFFSRTLKLSRTGSLVAGTVYMFSPYMFQYEVSMTALLVPVAALGWMMALTMKALQKKGNLWCLLFAVVVALSSSINATAFIYVALGPVILTVYMVLTHETTLRKAVVVSFKYIVLSFLVSVYWIEGLLIEGKYGLNILKLTESLTAISATSTPAEVFRGLGYWYYYASDSYGPIIKTSIQYQSWIWLLFLSFLLPVLGILSASMVRWRYKTLNISFVIIGMVISIGLYPLNHPSFLGSKVEGLMNGSEVGLALRSTTRAVPLVVMGLAISLGSLASLVRFKFQKFGVTFFVGLILIAVLNVPGIFLGNTVESNMSRGAIPNYWYQAANYLSKKSDLTRVIQEPGQPFDTYNFGTTVDPILPALTTRPTVERRQVPMGSQYGVNLLDSLDNTFQRSDLNPQGLSAVLRLISAGDLLITNDESYDRYQIPAAQNVMQALNPLPKGLKGPINFGQRVSDYPPFNLPYFNNQTVSTPLNTPFPYPLVDYSVKDTRPIVRLESPKAPVVIDGDGVGILEAANAGLLDGNPTILYSGSYPENSLKSKIPKAATLVITDSNRKQTKIWSNFRDQTGEIETPNENFSNSNDNETDINLFPVDGTASQTVASFEGVKSIVASSYGDPYGFTPEIRPYNAFDTSSKTAWMTGELSNPINQWIKVSLTKNITANKIIVNQKLGPSYDRWISKINVDLFENKKLVKSFKANLNAQSRADIGQSIPFKPVKFDSVKVTIIGLHNLSSFPVSEVGFSNIKIDSIVATEVIKPPTDLLNALGKSSSSHRLVYLFSRQIVGAGTPRSSPEINIIRQMDVPTTRKFSVSGDATLSSQANDLTVNSVITGDSQVSSQNVITDSSGKLQGDVGAYSGSVVSKQVGSAWITPFTVSGPTGSWISFQSPNSLTFDQALLTFYADGQHSLPAYVTVSTEQGQRLIELPKKLLFKTKTGLETVKLNFPVLHGTNIRLTLQAIKPVIPKSYYGSKPQILPVAISGFNVDNLPVTITKTYRQKLHSLVYAGQVVQTPKNYKDTSLINQSSTQSLTSKTLTSKTLTSKTLTSKTLTSKTVASKTVASKIQNIKTNTGSLGTTLPIDGLLKSSVLPTNLPGVCRGNLATLDGKPIYLMLIGNVTDALEGKYFSLKGCGPDAAGITIKAGQHIFETVAGYKTGINIDQINFDSAATDQIGNLNVSQSVRIQQAPTLNPDATLKIKSMTSTKVVLNVETHGKPVWLILGENYSTGWIAKVLNGSKSLSNSVNSASSLIDAYANGWLITPPKQNQSYDIELVFAPQSTVDYALIISFLTLFLCIVGALFLLIKNRQNRKLHGSKPSMSEIKTTNMLSFEKTFFYQYKKAPLLGSFIAAVVSGLLVGAIYRPTYGILVLVITLVFCKLTDLRWILVGVAWAMLIYSCLWIVFSQMSIGYQPSAAWPSYFSSQSNLLYFSIILITVDATVIFCRKINSRTQL